MSRLREVFFTHLANDGSVKSEVSKEKEERKKKIKENEKVRKHFH